MIRYPPAALVLSAFLAGFPVTLANDCTNDTNISQKSHPFLANFIPCSYVKEYRPPTDSNRPVSVEFTIYIQDINSINAADMDFRVDLFLHMTWEDTRLNHSNMDFIPGRAKESDYITLPAYVIDHIWTPDPYVTNAKDAAITKLTTTYASVTLYRNHSIRYSARVYSIIGCQMDFHGYPMDVQVCSMIMQSFMYSPKEVEFKWRTWSPVMINKELKLLQFSLKKPLNNYVKNSNDNELGHGEHVVRQLVVDLQFSREIGHHLVQTFVPSFLVVALSWFSFWLGLEAIPGRVTLLVTSLLTITTLFTGIKEGLPPVAYVKAIDVWMAGCMVFIFAALGEFVVIRVLNVMHARYQVDPIVFHPQSIQPTTLHSNGDKYDQRGEYFKRVTIMSNRTSDNGDITPSGRNNRLSDLRSGHEQGRRAINMSAAQNAWDPEAASSIRPHLQQQVGRLSLQWIDPKTGEKKILWKEIDKASRIVFPLMFLLFMIIYFPILVSRAF
ncbi:glycine receptor subunit alpha-4-like isoform X2 [Panulirus ornatus]|uniref:glycine receptor subunit alpha-4-like isoform X2 n=1 Tax=Panulirus ornatus TaxID=150431 RepID=UPI003A8A9676